jgi:hypothetical protein
MPPLYRMTQGSKTEYARDDAHREQLLKTVFKGSAKVEVGRFKGLGEMMPAQLKETTMKPGNRTLVRVDIAESNRNETEDLVERLMGKKPELRFQYIQENAQFATNVDVWGGLPPITVVVSPDWDAGSCAAGLSPVAIRPAEAKVLLGKPDFDRTL